MPPPPSIPEIRRRLKRARPDLPVERVLNAIEKRYTNVMWFTPSTLSEDLGLDFDKVVDTLTMLTGEPYDLLRVEWSITEYDHNGDVQLTEIDPLEAVASLLTGKLRHPHTGEEIKRPERELMCHYVPTRGRRRARG